MRLLLVHSPLVGPLSLEPLARELRRRAYEALTPDLTDVAVHADPLWMIDAACSAVPDGDVVDVVIGHSGAGVLLPAIGHRLRVRVGIVFLDAGVPASGADAHVTSDRQWALLHEHVDPDGRLRPWLEWWSEEQIASLLPDTEQRGRFAAESPRLPLAFYRAPVPLPAVWPRAGYVGLSAGYLDEAARADDRGWPTRTLDLDHLAPVTGPSDVADAVIAVCDHLRQR